MYDRTSEIAEVNETKTKTKTKKNPSTLAFPGAAQHSKESATSVCIGASPANGFNWCSRVTILKSSLVNSRSG